AVTVAPRIAAWGSSEAVVAWPVPLRLLAGLVAAILSQGGLWAEVYLITGMIMDAIQGRAPSPDSTAAYPLEGMKKGMVFGGIVMAILYGVGILELAPLIRWSARNYPIVLCVLLGAVTLPALKTIIETFDGSRAFWRRLGRSYSSPVLYLRGAVAGLGS